MVGSKRRAGVPAAQCARFVNYISICKHRTKWFCIERRTHRRFGKLTCLRVYDIPSYQTAPTAETFSFEFSFQFQLLRMKWKEDREMIVVKKYCSSHKPDKEDTPLSVLWFQQWISYAVKCQCVYLIICILNTYRKNQAIVLGRYIISFLYFPVVFQYLDGVQDSYNINRCLHLIVFFPNWSSAN